MRHGPVSSVRCLLTAGLLMVLATPAAAQTSTVLAHFESGPRAPVGSLVQAGPNAFYGVTNDGGAFFKGTVFVLYRTATGPWATFTLHSFSGLDGARPRQGLLLALDGNFYGTTTEGGALGGGTVFRISPFGGLVTLRSFPVLDGVAYRPAAPLTQSADGFIWGTTCPHSFPSIGSTAKSTVFRMTMAGGFTTIYESPLNNLCLQSLAHADDGRLPGLAHWVPPFGTGPLTQVVRLTRTGQLTVLNTVSGVPQRLFRGSGGVFYALVDHGSRSIGGPTNSGEALGFTVDGTVVMNAAINTGNPETLVEATPGVLYGTSMLNVSSVETFFRIDADGQVSVVEEWPPSVEPDISMVIGRPRVSLTRGSDGLLYGLSSEGGRADAGVAFTLDLSGNAATLSTFAVGPMAPVGPLVESAGALYGTSCGGGERGRGTIFRVTLTGAVTTLASFGGERGDCPQSLLKGPDGHFYGNTFTGTIFRMSEAGVVTVLYDLGPAGGRRQTLDTLTADASGNLWGNWLDGNGAFVYRLTPDGAFTRFPLVDNVTAVGPGVTVASDGNLFGAVHLFDLADPLTSSSQLFRMTPEGAVTSTFRFPGLHFVIGRLLPASDGLLYGTAATRTAPGGIVFSATPEGAVTTLHTFNEAQGFNSLAELTELATGELAGVTFGTGGWRFGFDNNFGIVFALSKAGVLRELHRFTWIDGANPYGPLLRGSDGALYGTTTAGGFLGGGVVYRIPQ